MDYSSLTDILNSRLINSETEKNWVNIPGGLDKISETSSAAWGLSSGKLYVCALPCTGQWVEQLDGVTDFTTDDSLVYVLTSGLQTKNGNGSGEWSSPITVPSITQLFNTGSNLWGQGSEKYKLAKPGTTANWISVPDTSDIKITSSSLNTLYGVDSAGKAYKSGENLSWTLIPQFKGVYTGVLGDGTNLYGTNIQQKIEKCVGSECSVEDTPPVKSLYVNPLTSWITSTQQSDYGNIFYKDDSPSNIIQDVEPIDQEREGIVQQTEKDYEVSTYSNVMSKQLSRLQTMFMNLPPKEDTQPLKSSLKDTTDQLEVLKKATPFLFELLLLLGGIVVVYLCSSFLGFTTHYVALAVFIGGLYYILNNGV
jgi:hypothetical protein